MKNKLKSASVLLVLLLAVQACSSAGKRKPASLDKVDFKPNQCLEDWPQESNYKNTDSWSNWVSNIVATPDIFLCPSSKDVILTKQEYVGRIQELVSKAIENHKTPIRIVGGGHTWSKISAVNQGTLIHLGKLKGEVTVEKRNSGKLPDGRPFHIANIPAGIALHDLDDVLDRQGLALANMGSINQQSLAGVVATATHGSGAAFGTFADIALGVTVVGSDGKVMEASADQNPELFRMVRSGMGVGGVMAYFKLMVVDQFNLHHLQEKVSLSEAAKKFKALYSQNVHTKMWILPINEGEPLALFVRQNPTQERPRSQGMEHLLDAVEFNVSQENLDRFDQMQIQIQKHPDQKETLESEYRMLQSLSTKSPLGHGDYIDKSFNVFAVGDLPKHVESEVVIPFKNFDDVMEVVREEFESRAVPYPVVEIRIVKASDSRTSPYLAPNQGNTGDLFVYLDLYWIIPHPWVDYPDYFQEVVHKLQVERGVPLRFHWGKLMPHWSKSDFRKAYGANYDEFVAQVKRWDPNGVFLSDDLKAKLHLDE